MTEMETINKGFVYFICSVSAMGGLLFGYDWVVIGGAKPFYELYYQIADSPSQQGLAMTMALIGCLIGAMLCGTLADRIGRKKLLIVSALIFFFSALATGLADTFPDFLVARFFWWYRYRCGFRTFTYVYSRGCANFHSRKIGFFEPVDHRVRYFGSADY